MHSAHTQGLGCACTAPRLRARRALGAVSWRIRCRIMAPLWPCRSAHWPCRRPPVLIQILYHDSTLLHRIVRRWAPCRRPCRGTKATPSPRYKILYRDTPQWPGLARRSCRSPRLQAGCVATPPGRIIGPCRSAAALPYSPAWSCRAWPCAPRPCLS